MIAMRPAKEEELSDVARLRDCGGDFVGCERHRFEKTEFWFPAKVLGAAQ
jgi:hypothetical protein